MARRRRRLQSWARHSRVGLWLAVLVLLMGLAYGLVRLLEATGRYAPSDYEPKDWERQHLLERGTGGR